MITLKISDLFRQLSYGELSNLAISDSGSGDIIEAKWPQLIQYTNEALTALYSRFVLSEKELVVEQVAGETRYPLTSTYAVFGGAGSGVPNHFILDTVDAPFKDDLIRVLAVWDANGNYPLNDKGNDLSLFTPTPLTLQVPTPVADGLLSVGYQAKHPALLDEITEDVTNLLDQTVDLPFYFENALQQLVAYKVFCHMNGQENIMKGQEFLAAYEADCLRTEQLDLANQTTYTGHDKLEERGFV